MSELLMGQHYAIILTYCEIRYLRDRCENYLVNGTTAEYFSVDITLHKLRNESWF